MRQDIHMLLERIQQLEREVARWKLKAEQGEINVRMFQEALFQSQRRAN